MYVELHARSAFSFLEGASLPELLMARAAELEMPAMALLDRNGLYGAPRFYMTAQRAGTRAHVGAEIAVRDAGERVRPPAWLPHGVAAEPVRFALLVESSIGYQNLCRLITRFKLREGTKAEGSALLEDVARHAEGLVCLTGGDEGPLAAALARGGYAEGCGSRAPDTYLRPAKCFRRIAETLRPRRGISQPGRSPDRAGIASSFAGDQRRELRHGL